MGVVVRFRGWCTPLTRGSAVCGAKCIAQHANPGLLSSPVRLSAFPQNVIKRNQAGWGGRRGPGGVAVLCGGSSTGGVAQAGKEGRGQNMNYCPPPSTPFTACANLLYARAPVACCRCGCVFLRKIQRCRGAGACLWLVAALCVGQNASHNTQKPCPAFLSD